jgi:hypothetical protein
MSSEVWRDIPGTSGAYQASDLGRVRSVDRKILKLSRWGFEIEATQNGRVLKPWTDSSGYLVVYICADGKRDAANVHRLAAETFLSPPAQDGLDVNHLDGNKQNNAPSNLEWCTRKENMAHARATGLHNPYKPIKATPIKGGKPLYFKSAKEASETLGVDDGNISSAANGKLRQAYGYFWEHLRTA